MHCKAQTGDTDCCVEKITWKAKLKITVAVNQK